MYTLEHSIAHNGEIPTRRHDQLWLQVQTGRVRATSIANVGFQKIKLNLFRKERSQIDDFTTFFHSGTDHLDGQAERDLKATEKLDAEDGICQIRAHF